MDLLNLAPVPLLPGTDATGPMVTAIVYDVVLDEPGIHTRRHFAGVLETHPFFSREAVHSALFDICYAVAPAQYQPLALPYGATPLWAVNPAFVTLKYGSTDGWTKTATTDRALTIGTMQAMAPGTLLRGAVWGDPGQLPDLFPERSFLIGKRRAAARVVRCVRADVAVTTQFATATQLPVQVDRAAFLEPQFRRIAFRKLAETHRYSVIAPRLGPRVPRLVLDDVTVPALEYWDRFND